MGKLQNFKNNCIELRDFTTKTVKKPKNTQNPIENKAKMGNKNKLKNKNLCKT